MRRVWYFLAGISLVSQAHAQTVKIPVIVPNDTWTYQNTTETRVGWNQTDIETTVTRAGPDEIAVDTRRVGSTMPARESLSGRDWDRFRSVNGQETVVNKPLSFPLTIGKSWTIDYLEKHPNRQHDSERFRSVFTVTSWEDVTVPAGTFHAIKIEAEGTWWAVSAPATSAVSASRIYAQGATTLIQAGHSGATSGSGRTYKSFWYVPGVKKWVKSVEEYYDAGGVRTARYSEELKSYKVSDR